MATILVMSGSTRRNSYNKALATVLAKIASDQGADVNEVFLTDYALPLYNGDLEDTEGLPDAAVQLKDQLKGADGFVVTCPEYNGFMTPLLINTIDWCTRSDNGGGDLSAFSGNVALITSASPGAGGGARAAAHLKTMLSGIGTHVLPGGLAIASAHSAFDDQGNLVDKGSITRAEKLIAQFLDVCDRLG